MAKRKVKPCPEQKVTSCGGKYYYDADSAERVVIFFEEILVLSQGDFHNKPFLLEDWQKKFLRTVFGWKKKSNGKRRFRKSFLGIPKKNGKSTLCAGLANYLLVADGEYGAEIYSAATERGQAKIVFDEAARMVALSSLKSIVKHTVGRLIFPEMQSKYETISRESKSKHGLNIHGLIFDELHALKDAELYEFMTHGSGYARSQPLHTTITTAGHDRTSVCYDEYCHAKKVIKDEKKDEQLFAMIFEAGKDDDWKNPEVWKKANPNMGVTFDAQNIEDDAKQAIENPRHENNFKRLNLNIWTSQLTRWLQREKWDSCAGKVSDGSLLNQTCYGGLDLSTVIDITAFSLIFPMPDGRLYLKPYFFIPIERIEEMKNRDKVPYDRWVAQGHIIATPGDTVDYDSVIGQMVECSKLYDLKDIAYDPWNASMAASTAEKMGLIMVPTAQGYGNMSPPSREFERQIIKGAKDDESIGLVHSDNPVMNWMIDNVEVQTGPNGVIRPFKPAEKGGNQKKIDGVVSSILSVDRYMRRKESDAPEITFF